MATLHGACSLQKGLGYIIMGIYFKQIEILQGFRGELIANIGKIIVFFSVGIGNAANHANSSVFSLKCNKTISVKVISLNDISNGALSLSKLY